MHSVAWLLEGSAPVKTDTNTKMNLRNRRRLLVDGRLMWGVSRPKIDLEYTLLLQELLVSD
jgi:hypothetical protein